MVAPGPVSSRNSAAVSGVTLPHPALGPAVSRLPRDNRELEDLLRSSLSEPERAVLSRFRLTPMSRGILLGLGSIPAVLTGVVAPAPAHAAITDSTLAVTDASIPTELTGTVGRQTFVERHSARHIDLGLLSRNPEALRSLSSSGVSLSDLISADADGNGRLGPNEAFSVADRRDRNGSGSSLLSSSADGRATPAGLALVALDKLLARDDLQPPPNSDVSFNDRILFVGMNNPTLTSAGAAHEIKELRKTGADLVTVTDSKAGLDKIRVGATTYDLTTAEGRAGFVATLQLPSEKAAKVAAALEGANRDSRDELAAIAQIWAKAERGESAPSRLVISGHHVGSGVYGDGNGRISWPSLEALSKALPRGAAHVEDLHIAACYSGGEAKETTYRGMFPNLKTVWAYNGSAPGAGSGATVHEAAWERGTRGRASDVSSTAEALKNRNVRKAEVIYTGSAAASINLASLRSEVEAGEAIYNAHFDGSSVSASSQTGPLREYYNRVQSLLSSPSLSYSERSTLEGRRDVTIRILYYSSHIAPRFAQEHGASLQAAFQSAGLTAPNFATASRVQVRTALEALRNSSGASSPEVASAISLLDGFYNLRADTVPEGWI